MVVFQVKLLQDSRRRNFFTSQAKENNQTKNSLPVQKKAPLQKRAQTKKLLNLSNRKGPIQRHYSLHRIPIQNNLLYPIFSHNSRCQKRRISHSHASSYLTRQSHLSKDHWCLLLKKRIIMLSQRISQNSSSDFILLCSLQKLIKSSTCKVKQHIFLRPGGNSLLRLWIYRNIRKADFSVGLDTMRRHTSSQKEHHCTQ
mgnify:CR=1 FL=1